MFNIKKILAVNVKKLRELNKMSQAEFAEAVSLQVQAISQIENAKTYPSSETVAKICDVFRVSPAVLFSCADYFSKEQFNSKKEIIEALNAALGEFDEDKLKFILEFLALVKKS